MSNHNFGDELSPYLVERLFGLRPVHSGMATAELLGVGSLLQMLEELGNPNHPHIWGTGFIEDGGRFSGSPVVVHAVRGPLTMERIREHASAPVPLGDPGILAPLAFPQFRGLAPRHRICVVPHHHDVLDARVLAAATRDGITVANPLSPLASVIRTIASAELVLSSSLHGLITAEAFGVPCAWTPLSDRVQGGGYKFEDFYGAFGRRAVAADFEELVVHSDLARSRWSPLEGMRERQAALVDAFPGWRRPRSRDGA